MKIIYYATIIGTKKKANYGIYIRTFVCIIIMDGLNGYSFL